MDSRPVPLRIAVVTETFPPEVNGVAMTMGQLVAGLRQRGHRLQLVRPRQGPEDRGGNEPGLEQVLTGGLPLPGYGELRMGRLAGRRLLSLWQGQPPDLVHLVTEGPLGWSALAAARRLGLPVTSAFHTHFHSYSRHYGLGWLSAPIAHYLRVFHNRTALTLVPTQALRRELCMKGLHKLEVLGRGVDTRLFDPARRSMDLRAAWGASAVDPVAIYVGRLAPEKNLQQVLAAFTALRARHRGARLVLVGDGPLRSRLEGRWSGVIFAGMRTGLDLATHYASADVFLFASLTETYGNVTLEAMASGLAVVAYDYAAANELISHGENGLLAPFGSGEDFCAAAATLADLDRAHTLGRSARRRALAQDWSFVQDRFEELLLEVAARAQGRAHAPGIPLGTGQA